MEEKNNLTAERSLEIIRESIERSRQLVSKSTGQSLYIAGNCMMAISAIIAIIIHLTESPLGHLLWFVLPLIIVLTQKYNKQDVNAPVSFIGTLVGKTWWTFATFTLLFFLVTIVWNSVLPRFYSPDLYVVMRMKITPIIVLMMGMTVSITGYIIRSRWLVVFGIIAGIGTFVWEWSGIGSGILFRLSGGTPYEIGVRAAILPCLTFCLFAFFGLTIPGYMLKRQSL